MKTTLIAKQHCMSPCEVGDLWLEASSFVLKWRLGSSLAVDDSL